MTIFLSIVIGICLSLCLIALIEFAKDHPIIFIIGLILLYLFFHIGGN